MKRGVVSVEDTEAHRELLSEAGEYAASVDADLFLMWFIDPEAYQEELDTLETIGDIENVTYNSEVVTDAAVAEAREFARDVLGDLDVSFDIAVDVVNDDERAQQVVTAGMEHDCDHAFIVGRARSPTGKALFGDFAQHVILNFDGYVTVAMR